MRTLSTSFMILRGLGVWPPSDFSSLYKRLLYKLYTSIGLLAVSVHLGTGIIGLVVTGRSLIDVANYGSRILSSGITFGKLLNVIFYRDTILDILETLESGPCLPRDNEEILIQKKHNRNVQNITIRFGMIMNLTVCLLISHTILHDIPIRKLPRKVWLPYDHSDGIMYWLSCCFQVITMIYLYITMVGYDTLVCGMFLEISTKLNILQYRFENLYETLKIQFTDRHCSPEDIPKIETSLITDCVNFHLCLFNLAERVNSTFSLIIFLQYVMSTAVLCLTVYNISGMKFNSGIIFVIFYLCNMLFEIFLYCACAHEVTLESENIARSVFRIDWMNFSRITWKSVLIIGYQSCRPIIFTSGHFVTLSLDSFKSLIKVAYSVFNALKSVQ